VLKGHYSAVTSLSLSPDGWTLLSGGRDSVVVAWNMRDHSKLSTVPVFEALEGELQGHGLCCVVVLAWNMRWRPSRQGCSCHPG